MPLLRERLVEHFSVLAPARSSKKENEQGVRRRRGKKEREGDNEHGDDDDNDAGDRGGSGGSGGSDAAPPRKRVLELCTSINPDQVVAEGAAIRAAILTGVEEEVLHDVMMIDVVPQAFGLEGADGGGGQQADQQRKPGRHRLGGLAG